MVDDIYREVDEEVRRDKAAKFWAKNKGLIITACALIVGGVAAYRVWDHFDLQKRADAGRKLDEALTLSEAKRGTDAEAAFADIAATGPKGQALLARFRGAAEIARRDAVAGAASFDALAKDAGIDANFRELAQVKALSLRVDKLPLNEVIASAEPLSGAGKPYRPLALELMGLAAYKAGDTAKAIEYLDRLMVDADAATGARQRAELLMALLRSGAATPQK